MAEITPIDDIRNYDKHELQQILLERDESIERLAIIAERDATIMSLQSSIDELKEEIKQRDESHQNLANDKAALLSKLESIEGTEEFKQKKIADALAQIDAAEKLKLEAQAQIDAIS